MKANHPNEAKRWIEAIGRNIEYFKHREREGGVDSDTSSLKRRKSIESWSGDSIVKFGIANSSSNGSTSIGGHKVFWRKSGGSNRDRDQESIVGSISGPSSIAPTPIEPSLSTSPDRDYIGSEKEDDDDEESTDTKESDLEPPHPNLELQGNALIAQLEITNRLVESIISSQGSTTQTTQTHQALTESVQTTQAHLSTYLHMSREREDWFARQLKKEGKRQRVWEESLAVVVKEGEGLERELRKRRGRRPSFMSGGGTQKIGKGRPSVVRTGTIRGPTTHSDELAIANESKVTAPTPLQASTTLRGAPIKKSTTSDTLVVPIPPAPITITPAAYASDEEDYDTDQEDEFFDAIETGNLPNLVVYEGLTSPKSITSAGLVTPRASMHEISNVLGPSDIRSLSISQTLLLLKGGVTVEPFAGYTNLRNRLSITDDDRPSTSLWSVLKHSIGKDLTKISIPVFFNEPTSMLQRMAEDMEFSECRESISRRNSPKISDLNIVDVAAHEKDPLQRIAFVAAFAMSNYSSTIGRIAKPFNPMLVSVFSCLSRTFSHEPCRARHMSM